MEDEELNEFVRGCQATFPVIKSDRELANYLGRELESCMKIIGLGNEDVRGMSDALFRSYLVRVACVRANGVLDLPLCCESAREQFNNEISAELNEQGAL